MTCRKNNRLEKKISTTSIYRPWISRWKETPLVIGVKENVPPVCHEVLGGTHSTSLTQPSIIHLLNRSYCHLLSLLPVSCPLHPFPFLTLSPLCLSLQASEGRSNEFLLLIRRAVSVLYCSVELQQMERAFIRFEASAATPKCHRGI